MKSDATLELLEKSIDTLARSTREGFGLIDKHFDQVDKRFDQVDKRFEGVDKSIENLARITKKEFEKVNKRFDEIDKRIELIEVRIEHMDARLRMIEMDIAEIRKNLVYRDEFERLATRVELLEQKLQIQH